MVRFVELSRVVRSAVPVDFASVYAAVTALGGSTFLMVGLAALYWAWDDRRREVALVVSFAVAALAATVVLKSTLAMERPPSSARLLPLYDDGYGFPSGHAVAATVVYGGLVTTIDRLRAARWRLAAVTVVAIVALSRVVLGVHYLGDVLAGVAVGVALLGVLGRASRGDPTRGFAIAAVAAVPAVAVTGVVPTAAPEAELASEAVFALGGAFGGALGSRHLDRLPRGLPSRWTAALLALGVSFIAVTQLARDALATAAAVAAVFDLLLVAGILLLPAAALPIAAIAGGDAVRL